MILFNWLTKTRMEQTGLDELFMIASMCILIFIASGFVGFVYYLKGKISKYLKKRLQNDKQS